jgi:hypothetical protein
MRARKTSFFIVTAALMLLHVPAARAEKPVNLSLVTPLQIFSEAEAIKGFRFSLFYGRQSRMTGFDLGLVNHVTGEMYGVQWGAANVVEGNCTGWQAAVFNYTKGAFLGAQTGVVNYAGTVKGLQFGLVNWAGSMQKGLQIGLANIIQRDGWLPFMVIVNGRL